MASPLSLAVLVIAASTAARPPLETLRPDLEKAAGGPVEIRYGATGLLAREIEEGGRYDVFVAADEGTVRRLAQDGRIEATSVTRCATGRLAVVAARDWDHALPRRLDGATAIAFAKLPFRRVAVPSAKTSPYGGAVKELLSATRIAAAVKERLVEAESAEKALALVLSGEAETGLGALSLARASGLPWTEVDPTLHEPLRHVAGVVTTSARKDAARRAVEALASPEAGEIWRLSGFAVP